MSNFNNSDEFETRKFNLDEIAMAEKENDYSLNPEATKFYEDLKKENEKPVNKGKTDGNKKKMIIAAVSVFLVGLIIFMVVILNLTSRNDVFYTSDPEDIKLEKQEPNPEETDEYEELLEPVEDEKNEKDKPSPYKGSIGNYIFTSSSEGLGNCSYNVYVSNVTDDGTILFAVVFMNEDSTIMYETGTISATLNGNKAEFNWSDNHGNSGIGELELLDNSVSVMLIQNETAEGNTASLATDNPVTIQKTN